jgi:acetylornithine deacetylase/succinyl-diaminopimelate desuccinylase-like protein
MGQWDAKGETFAILSMLKNMKSNNYQEKYFFSTVMTILEETNWKQSRKSSH